MWTVNSHAKRKKTSSSSWLKQPCNRSDTQLNLMEFTRGQFNSLVTGLLQEMGFDVRLSLGCRSTWVGSAMSVAGKGPGDKVLFQVVRSENTVGVSHVRQLFGTMVAEKTMRGILLATSGYSKAAFDFANGKPIELLAGGSLLYLLKEHADIEAKIIMPTDPE